MIRIYFLSCSLGAILTVSLSSTLAYAQTDTGTTGGVTTGSTTTVGSTTVGATTGGATGGTTVSGLGGGGGVNANSSNSQNSSDINTAIQAVAVRSVTSGAGSATSIPSNSNVFVQTYVDPLSLGVASKWAQFGVPAKPSGTFGKALYVNATNTNTATRGGGGLQRGGTGQQGSGFTTFGTPRTPSYATVLDSELQLPPPSAPRQQTELRAALARSSYLSNQSNIEIIVKGYTVELRGNVATEKERRAAENIVGTSPGVYDVINQLQVGPKN